MMYIWFMIARGSMSHSWVVRPHWAENYDNKHQQTHKQKGGVSAQPETRPKEKNQNELMKAHMGRCLLIRHQEPGHCPRTNLWPFKDTQGSLHSIRSAFIYRGGNPWALSFNTPKRISRIESIFTSFRLCTSYPNKAENWFNIIKITRSLHVLTNTYQNYILILHGFSVSYIQKQNCHVTHWKVNYQAA